MPSRFPIAGRNRLERRGRTLRQVKADPLVLPVLSFLPFFCAVKAAHVIGPCRKRCDIRPIREVQTGSPGLVLVPAGRFIAARVFVDHHRNRIRIGSGQDQLSPPLPHGTLYRATADEDRAPGQYSQCTNPEPISAQQATLRYVPVNATPRVTRDDLETMR